MSRLFKSLGYLLLLLIADSASAQTIIQTEFEIKRGFIYLDYPKKGLAFDSVVDLSRQNISVNYTQLGEYKVVLWGTGAIYAYKEGNNTTKNPVYPEPKLGGWPAELIAYADSRLLFLSITDGYIRPRRETLVELSLAKRTYQIIGRGKHIESITYSSDLSRVSFLKDGTETIWVRREPGEAAGGDLPPQKKLPE